MPQSRQPAGLVHAFFQLPALSPIASFCLSPLWVKSQNKSDRDAILKRSVLHPTYCPGPFERPVPSQRRTSRAMSPCYIRAENRYAIQLLSEKISSTKL